MSEEIKNTQLGESDQISDTQMSDPEMQARIDEINQILSSDTMEPTVAINIIISAVQASFDKDHFTEIDRVLISKALNCLKSKVDAGEDIIIKVDS